MVEVRGTEEQLLTITGFVDELVVATHNNRIYWPGHPRVNSTIRELLRRLEEHFSRTDDEQLVLGVLEGYLVYDGRPLLGATLSALKLIQPIERVGAAGIAFDRETVHDDIVALLDFLGNVRSPPKDDREANRFLQNKGCTRIRILPARCYESRDRLAARGVCGEVAGGAATALTAVPVELYQSVIETLQGVSVTICRGETFRIEDARTRIEDIQRKVAEDPGSMLGLARYEQYDAFTFGHSIRVAILALHLTRTLTRDEAVLNRVGVAALLHDVGKARVPFEILHARGELTPDERREMEKHTIYGAEILLELCDTDPVAVAAAFGHHRTVHGHGYPAGAYGDRTSLVTRIVKVCDVYEALTAVRPYKDPVSPARAFRIMLTMEGHFEPSLLRRFIAVHGIYPAGTVVRLDTGELARVTEQTDDLERPRVAVVTTRGGDPLREEDRRVLDLSRCAAGTPAIAAGPVSSEAAERAAGASAGAAAGRQTGR